MACMATERLSTRIDETFEVSASEKTDVTTTDINNVAIMVSTREKPPSSDRFLCCFFNTFRLLRFSMAKTSGAVADWETLNIQFNSLHRERQYPELSPIRRE